MVRGTSKWWNPVVTVCSYPAYLPCPIIISIGSFIISVINNYGATYCTVGRLMSDQGLWGRLRTLLIKNVDIGYGRLQLPYSSATVENHNNE